MRVCSATFLAAALVAAVPVASIPVARAQPAAKPVDKKKLAKQYVDSGLAAQNAGDHDTALTFYGKAYELVPHPVLLFNMAQANRLAGRTDVALDLYQRYLAEDPKGPQAKTAREHVAAIEGQRAAAEAAKADEARKAEAARLAEEAREAEDARKAADARSAEQARRAEEARLAAEAAAPPALEHPEQAPTSEAPPSPGKGLRLAGLGVGGAGVVAIGAGVFFGLKASSLSSELSEPGAVYDPQKVEDGEAAERTMLVLTGVGAALLIGGGVVYYLGRKKGESAQVTLAPTAGGALLVVGGDL